MKYYAFFTLLLIGCYSCTSTETSHQEEWIALFNGKDLSDWTIKFANQDLNFNHRNTFRAQDSMIRIAYDQYDSFNDAYAHMYYNKPYSYYKLRFDYRFTGEQVKGGEDWNVRNSGIMLHSQSAESNDYGQYFPVSIEIQLLGGLGRRQAYLPEMFVPPEPLWSWTEKWITDIAFPPIPKPITGMDG
jgi:hypothetical protein